MFVMDLCACCMAEQEWQLHKRFVNTSCFLAVSTVDIFSGFNLGKNKVQSSFKEVLTYDCCSGQFFAQIIAMHCL